MTPWLTILGINEDGALSAEAVGFLREAGLVMGGRRHLGLAARWITGRAVAWPRPMEDGVPALLAHRPGAAVVLASGDPLWFGVGTLLLRHVPVGETRILPAPSSFSLAAARLGWSLQSTVCVSCCGRPVEALVPHLQPGARLLVLSAGAETPGAVLGLLGARGVLAEVQVLEALGGADERVGPLGSGEVGALNIVAVEVLGPVGRTLPIAPGLDDALFESDGQLTKKEVRALTLAALAPRRGERLWDVGAGAGSVGIEWMLRDVANEAVAIERDAGRAERAGRNAWALGVPGLRVVQGEAPGVFAGLEAPDAIFLGGGGHLPGMIEAAWGRLRPGGRMVANAIALATEAALVAGQGRFGGSLTRIAVERLDQVGGMAAYRPAMTVTQWRVEKPECE